PLFLSRCDFTMILMSSPGAIFLIIPTYAHGMGPNFPGQSLMLCGHPTQVASCACHSAGMRKPSAAGLRPKAFEVRFGIIKGGYFAGNRRVSDSGRVISEHYIRDGFMS